MGISKFGSQRANKENYNLDIIMNGIKKSMLPYNEGFLEGNKNRKKKNKNKSRNKKEDDKEEDKEEDKEGMEEKAEREDDEVYQDYKKLANEQKNTQKQKEKKKDPLKWWINFNGFPDFFDATLSGIVKLTLYFYLGVNYDLLSKSTQLNPGGMKGQSVDGPPYIGNFQECAFKDNIDLREPISKWMFPYKNSVMCNTSAHRERPLYFRAVYWSVGMLAFSYATGRSFLNYFLSGSDQNVNILTGPPLTFLILFLTVIIGSISTIVGAFTNLDKLLPKCYYTFWFPFLTFMVFMIGIFAYPLLFTSFQAIAIVYFLFLHIPFVKTEFMEDGTKKISRGLLTIAKRIFTNPMYFFFLLVTIGYNAYKHIGFLFASPIIGWSVYHVFQKYSTYLLNDY